VNGLLKKHHPPIGGPAGEKSPSGAAILADAARVETFMLEMMFAAWF
jgi:hypothetical protein